MRFEVYRETVDYIEKRNSNETQEKEGLTYKLGLNKFADWTKEERNKIRGIKRAVKINNNTK